MKETNIQDQKNRIDNTTLYLIVVGIIVVLNIICLKFYARLDLTRDGDYSLSAPSKKIVRQLREPMTVKVFFTRDLPSPYSTYYRYLEDILREYRASGRNFRFEFVDLKRFPNAPDEYGIQPIQLQVYEKDQAKFIRAHIGMVFLHGDVIERIPQITTTEGLEYKITSIIRKMNDKVDKLAALNGTVEVTLFVSGNLPSQAIQGLEGLSDKMKEKFDTLNKKFMGKLKYSFIDTASDPAAEKKAIERGAQRLDWPAFRNYAAGHGFIGLTVTYGDKHENVQLLGRNLFGQYYIEGVENLESTVQGVIDNIIGLNRKIGYVTGYGEPARWGGYGMMGQQQQSQNTIANLAGFIEEQYQFENLALKDKKIPADVDALLIVGPKQRLGDYELYQIDQFIMSGKPVAFLLNGLDFPQPPPEMAMYQQQPPQGMSVNTGLEYLLSSYGVRLNNNLVLDEKCYKQQAPREYGGGERAIYFAPIAEQDNISQKHIISRRIKGLVVLQASSIEPIDSIIKTNKITYTELIKTSKRAWQKGEGVMLNYVMPPEQTNEYKQMAVAATLEGPFKSYFEGKEIPAEPSTNMKKAAVQAASAFSNQQSGFIAQAKKARVFVLGSGEMAKNSLIDAEGKYPNAVFMKNVVDWLVADSDLIAIRKKGLTYNPMKQSSDLLKTIIKVINIFGLPLIVIAFGIFLWRIDMRRRQRIAGMFK
ncbi:MAG: Gldg family protein [Spirochaetes bacterium]|nr:Gldg family protein [Spirochaetota bacterium]